MIIGIVSFEKSRRHLLEAKATGIIGVNSRLPSRMISMRVSFNDYPSVRFQMRIRFVARSDRNRARGVAVSPFSLVLLSKKKEEK